MKTILIVCLCAIGLLGVGNTIQAFAKKRPPATVGASKYFSGTVIAKLQGGTVSTADIVVVNSKGEQKTFSILSSTAVTALRFNRGRNKVTAYDIKYGSKVSVRISTDPKTFGKVLSVVIAE